MAKTASGRGRRKERASEAIAYKNQELPEAPQVEADHTDNFIAAIPAPLASEPPDADEASTETSFPALDAAAFIELSDVTVVTEFAADPPPKVEAEQDSPSLTEKTAVPERTARLDLKGFIDRTSGGRVTGWAWDPNEPARPVTIDIRRGEATLLQVVANEYREDLGQAGIGDGRHAFAVSLPPGLLDSGENLLELRCADTGAEVPGSPIIVAGSPIATAAPEASAAQAVTAEAPEWPRPERAQPEPIRPVFEAERGLSLESRTAHRQDEDGLDGNIDIADWTGIRGWIWEPHDPQRRVALELFDGEAPLATIVANQYRPDLEQRGYGDGRYGFAIAFSETLLPYARHVLHLRPVGSNVEMASFPLELMRHEAGIDHSVQFVLDNVMAQADRANSTDDLAPIVTSLVGMLDVALARYFDLADDAAARPVELLNPSDSAGQFRTIVESIRWNYPALEFATDRPPLVSIVIPVFNKFELTYACLRSIAEHGAEIPFEIIIVDDCSRDETLLAGFIFGAGVKLIRNERNLGFVRSCNAGFDAARGDYVLFLNNDTEVKARWLDELYETMERDPKIGVVGSKLLFPDGSLQEVGGLVWRLGDAWNWGRGQAADDPRFCYMRDADYVSGAALMVRASLFSAAGKFDELYAPAYYEDNDLCFQARQLGYRVVVQPASEVVHFEGQSAGTSITGTGMKRFQAINHRKFLERWKETLATHRYNGEFPELEAERQVRQRALFIDDSVPEPDKDAGSNAAFQHMLSLQRLGYKVTFIPGDNMARIDPYTRDLQRRGIECLYHPYFVSVEDVFRKNQFPVDLVYLHRYSNASKYAGMVRQHFPKARIVYNVADLHFLRMRRQAELQGDAALRENAEHLRRLEVGAMSFVDCVIVHSNVEAELLREVAPHIEVRVIPWTVEPREINAAASWPPSIAFIGGYRHPPNVDAARWAVNSVMPLLRSKISGIELLLVGSNMPSEVNALAARDVVPLGYVPSLDTVFEQVRLTVSPLRYGAGLKGKVLESLAAGVPCVMTKISAEGLDLPPELEWLVVDEPELLADRVETLCIDDDRHRRIVEACRSYVAAHYSADRIDTQLREACGLE